MPVIVLKSSSNFFASTSASPCSTQTLQGPLAKCSNKISLSLAIERLRPLTKA